MHDMNNKLLLGVHSVSDALRLLLACDPYGQLSFLPK